MWIALAEFTECYNFVVMDLICELNMPRILLVTTFHEVTNKSVMRALEVIVRSGSTISGMGFRFTSILNLGLCLDVSLTLRYPFKQREARMRIMYISALLFASLSIFANQLVGGVAT